MQNKNIHIVIVFSHIGPYHLARLRAAQAAGHKHSWKLTVVQSIAETGDHPWGALSVPGNLAVKTLLVPASAYSQADLHPDSPAAAAAIAPCLDSLQPNVIVIPGWGFKVSRAALSWCRQHKIPAVLMSESKRDDEPRTWWKEQLKSWLYVRKYAAALVGGPAHKDYLVELGIERDRIFYGYDAVDNEYFAKQADIARKHPETTRQDHPTIPSRPYFLAVTRLLPRKNVIRLVQAFITYCEQVGTQNAWSLVICGSGAEQSAIQQLIADHNLENLIQLPGFITYQQIASWYALAGAFVHPALVEQWGLVVNEACAAGIPILCSRTVGACQSLVEDGVNGFTFDPADTSNLVQNLLKVHSLNEFERSKMGQASRRNVECCSPGKFGEGFLNSVQTALGRHL